jgi:hypothetical protein
MLSTGLKLSAAAALLLTAASPALSASHREAPFISEMPRVDNTDTYAFRSYEPGREGFVTLIANFQPFQEPGGGPIYYPLDEEALYEIMIDNNGDAQEDVTFQFDMQNILINNRGNVVEVGGKTLPSPLRFIGQITTPGDLDQGFVEGYRLAVVRGDRRDGTRAAVTTSFNSPQFGKPIDNVGDKTLPDYINYSRRFIYEINIPGCGTRGRVFVGQREENFAVNLGPIFDLVNFIPIQGDRNAIYNDGEPFPGGITQSDNNQELIANPEDTPRAHSAYNVTSLALEVPTSCLTGNGNGVIGVWSTASKPQSRLLRPNPTFNQPAFQGGSFVQVSRLGNPLVNELIIGLPQKNLFNAAEPTQDVALADFVTNPTFPEILNKLFLRPVNATLGTNFQTLAPTFFPRTDLVATFLTGIQGLNQQASVTPSEMIRLNTAINPTPLANQHPLGVLGDDLAGFPNGRRPVDDVVDIVLRVAMGRLCYPVPIAGRPTDLGLCDPEQAPTGEVDYTDGAPFHRATATFPYLNPPLRGSPRPQNRP